VAGGTAVAVAGSAVACILERTAPLIQHIYQVIEVDVKLVPSCGQPALPWTPRQVRRSRARLFLPSPLSADRVGAARKPCRAQRSAVTSFRECQLLGNTGFVGTSGEVGRCTPEAPGTSDEQQVACSSLTPQA
jgi:hypothetical protein